MPAETTLGICAHTHDSSAALFVGDRMIGFLEQDRLVGRKHTSEFPVDAITALLDTARIGPLEVDAVAYTFCPGFYSVGRAKAAARSGDAARRHRAVHSYTAIARAHEQTMARIAAEFRSAALHEIPHHEAHAFSAIAPRGWADCEILVVDSIGEAATTSLGTWRRAGKRLEMRALAWDTDSLGYLYGAVTDHLGFRMRDEEGTVMALAAFGDPARFRPLLATTLVLTERGFELSSDLVRQRIFGDSGDRLAELFIAETFPPRRRGDPLEQAHADLAAALQERIEKAFQHLVELHPNPRGNWALSGGVASNCVAAGRIRRLAGIGDVYIPPAPGDSGTSLGAAVAVILHRQGRLARVPGSPYWGTVPDIPGAQVVAALGYWVERPQSESQLASMTAAALAAGKIVGVYRGPAEAGPRALGHRSVLAGARSAEVHDRLAVQVKKRERFRPFAPIILADEAPEYFDLRGGVASYMSFAVPARQLLVEHAPAVVHRNGTARVQTVPRGADAFLEAVLTRYREASGSPLLINTSLNVKGMPTTGTWRDALRCLTEMGLDALVLGDLYVTEGTGTDRGDTPVG